MSLVKRFFGQSSKKKGQSSNNQNNGKQQATSQINKAIQDLRAHITLLTKRKEHSEKQIAEYNKQAQQCLKAKNRNGALAKIKLRKQVEKRLETLDNQIFNLETQIMALDESAMNQQMLDTMKVVRDTLQSQNIESMATEMEETHVDIQEAMDLNNELNNILGTSLVDYDEEELEQELNELNDDMIDDGLLYSQINQKKKIVLKESTVDMEEEKSDQNEDAVDEEIAMKELRKLEVEMNLTANDRKIVDAQIVQNHKKMAIVAC